MRTAVYTTTSTAPHRPRASPSQTTSPPPSPPSSPGTIQCNRPQPNIVDTSTNTNTSRNTRTTTSYHCHPSPSPQIIALPFHHHERRHPSMLRSSNSGGNRPSKGRGRLRRHPFRSRLLPRRIRLPLLKKTWSGAVRQNGGASRAQYSRSLATSVADERSPVGRRLTPVVAIEHASTSSRANSFL